MNLFRGRKTPILTALLTGLSFVLSLLVLEFVFRSTHLLGARISWSTPDPLLAYRFVPGSRYWFNRENDHAIEGRINQYGWRDRHWSLQKPPGALRAAVLGDSYVEAFQVESDSTFLRLTEKRLSEEYDLEVELMNFGRSGCTQTEELLILERDVLQFKPDLVVLCFLPSNDIDDVRRETTRSPLRPYYVEDPTGQLVLQTDFRSTREYRLKTWIDPIKRSSALVSLLIERYTRRRALEHQPGNPASMASQAPAAREEIQGYMSLCTQRPDPEFVRSYALNKRLIAEMARLCRAHEAEFLLVCLDTDAYSVEREQELLEIDPTFDAFFFDRDLASFARTQGFEFLGLQRAFRKAHERGQSLHWSHWNYEGHRLVSRVLSEALATLAPTLTTEVAPASK